MPEYLQKTWYTTTEDLRLLKEIVIEISAGSNSSALRYCVRQMHKKLFKKTKP